MTQVTIVGGGITGLSTAYHLNRLGIDEITIIDDPNDRTTSRVCAGFVLGSMFDNITRIAHAYGLPFASQIYRFSQQAFASIESFCRQHNVPLTTAEHRRLIVSTNEKIEATKAVALFRQGGFAAQLLPVDPQLYDKERVYALQDDAIGGGYLDLQQLFAKLKVKATRVKARVTAISNNGSCVVDGNTLTSELIVIAGHHQIVELITDLSEIIIPYSDQWSVFKLTTTSNFLRRGQIYTANHGHEWAVVADNNTLHLGGARFLRRFAGIGDAKPCIDEKISNYLGQRFADYLPSLRGCLQLVTTTALIGVRPCDELPIIGPMYGNDRLLFACGYLGNGLSWGFQAGKCLAELIANGHSPSLPRQLWPERLRSIS